MIMKYFTPNFYFKNVIKKKLHTKLKILRQIAKLLHLIYFFSPNFTRNIKVFTPN